MKSSEEEVSKPYVFQVETVNRVFFLAAQSNTEKEAWIGCIGKQMVRRTVIKEFSEDEEDEDEDCNEETKENLANN